MDKKIMWIVLAIIAIFVVRSLDSASILIAIVVFIIIQIVTKKNLTKNRELVWTQVLLFLRKKQAL